MIRPLRPHPLHAALLAVVLAGPALPAAAQSTQTATAATLADLPAGPLGRSLSAFAAARGLALSYDPALTDGLQAPALHGPVGDREGMQRLLAGSGLRLLQRSDGSYTLVKAAPANAGSVALPVLRIGAQAPFPYAGGLTLDQDYIGRQPGGNGDIGTLLRINPAVQYDNAQLGSFTPGEISPAEISINGAKFYQNAFLIDGMGANNDIDPAREGTPYRLFAVPGTSQGLALDIDLLAEVTVLDSNVPASYGGFNGGVVEASTRKPTREAHGKVSMQMTRSAWTRYHIDPSLQEDERKASAWGNGQPEFDKVIYRASAEGYLTDRFGLLASFSRKRSTIPSYFYSSHLVDQYGREKQDSRRAIDNWFVKGVWDIAPRLSLEGSVTYAPEDNHYFRSNIRDSGINITRGGTQANFKLDWRTEWGRVRQQLGWNRVELSRDPDSNDYFSWYKSSTKDWGTGANSLQGEFGDIEQTQNTAQYKLDLDWDPVDWLGANHVFGAGLQLDDQHFRYARLTESSTYVMPKKTATCTNAAGVTDDHTCSLGVTATGSASTSGWAGQYFTRRTRYATGSFAFDTRSWALYAQDDIRIGRLQLRPGVRVDADSYMDQTTVAPRFALAYDVSGDGTTRLQAGANRYYGRNVAAWRLQEGINRLRYNNEARATLDSAWTLGTQATSLMKFSQLDIAYDDELMFGATQRWRGVEYAFKFVNRKGRDQVIQVSGNALGEPATDPTLSGSYTTWTNDGRSEADIYSFTATPLAPLLLGSTRTTWQLALDWTDVKHASPTYFDDGDDYHDNPIIQYRGSFIRYADRPAGNYARPWTARLTSTTEIPGLHLSWTNFLRYRAGYEDIGDTGRNTDYQGQSVDVWDRRTFSAALTWDLRLGWELPIGRQAVFANLDIYNLLDRANVYGTSPGTSSVPYYETGRSFWLEVGYRF